MTPRKKTTFRLNTDLMGRLRTEAGLRNCSLNSLVEEILQGYVTNSPNILTIKAIKETENEENLEILDLTNFSAFIKQL